MKKIFFVVLAFTLLTGCWKQEETPPTTVEVTNTTETTSTTTSLSVNDFQPPTGFDWGWENKGPYEMQLLSARSTDGVNWTRTSQNISRQANTPNMVVTQDGTIYLYYTGGNILGKDQTIAVAISQDNGTSWTYKAVTIEGDIQAKPGDPDVIIKEDGTFRLYFTSQMRDQNGSGIYYADATDGIHFTYKGEALQIDDAMVMDSSTFFWQDTWYMFTLDGFERAHVFASSKDGDSFTFLKKENMGENGGINYFLSNEIIGTDGILRAYGFDLSKNGDIRSATSENGVDWEDEGIVHLSLNEETQTDTIMWNDESYYLKDPAVVQLQDGSFFMVYVTRAQQ